MEEILKYFPGLSDKQLRQLEQLGPLYREWNEKINVISRKDIDYLYRHHILHSLVISKMIAFTPGTSILDLGTGGGFPGIPLAVLFPKTSFTLIDGTRKKIKVVKEISEAVGLENVIAKQIRAEELKQKFDFVVTRAVAGLDKLYAWSYKLIGNQHQNVLPNGIIALKGGDLRSEVKLLPRGVFSEIYDLADWYEEDFFAEKYAVYVQV